MSSDGKLSIILDKRTDDNGNVYYIGKLKGPIKIDASDGICFLIFTAIENEEEMQIGSMIRKNNDEQNFTSRHKTKIYQK